MPRLRLLLMMLIALGCLLDLAAPVASAQLFPRRHHVWGRFRPGSWRLVRNVTETLDRSSREVTSTSATETLTTLQSGSDDEVRLKVEASVEVGGKRLEGTPQQLIEGLLGEAADQNATVTDAGLETIQIEGQDYLCRILQVETTTPKTRSVSKTWYSRLVAPYVLKQHTTTTDLESKQTTEETTMEVVSLGVRRRVLLERRATAEIKVVHRNDRGRTEIRTWNCIDVPGGIVSQLAEEFDRAGKLVRRSQMELVDYSRK